MYMTYVAVVRCLRPTLEGSGLCRMSARRLHFIMPKRTLTMEEDGVTRMVAMATTITAMEARTFVTPTESFPDGKSSVGPVRGF